MPATISLTFENLPEFQNCWARATDAGNLGIHAAVERGCKEGAEEAIQTRTWKDRSGDARKATRGFLETKSATAANGVIECAVAYASYLDSGTVPHEIRPVRAQALRWYDPPGEAHFAKVVHHPGTRGDGFFGKAVHKAERVMIREVELGVVRAQRILDT